VLMCGRADFVVRHRVLDPVTCPGAESLHK
jgi:hypothetical protein